VTSDPVDGVVALGLAASSARAANRWRVLAKRVPKAQNLEQSS
jgi:hypothetical protein